MEGLKTIDQTESGVHGRYRRAGGCWGSKRSGRSAEIPDNSLDLRLNVDWLWTDRGG